MNLKLKRSLGFAASLAFTFLAGTSHQIAKADGSGCSPFSTDGRSCIFVKGSGLTVNSITASFSKPSRLCNWQYVIFYKNSSGVIYSSKKGPYHTTCDQSGSYTINFSPPGAQLQPGQVCVQLYSNNNSQGDASCANITR